MGSVYLAEQESPKRPVALKLLRASLATEERRRRFAHESQIHGALQHPGIAHIYGSGTWEEGGHALPWFALELVEGARPLNLYAREQGLPLAERLELFLKVCDAMSYAHHKGVVHRDLKPSNLLVDQTGQVKVIDFGCAREDRGMTSIELTQTGEIMGTLAYMAPEQFERGSRLADARDDLYSLGVVLYELLTDRLPVDVSGPLPQVVDRIRNARIETPSSLSSRVTAELDWVVMRTMEKDRERRYGSVSELAADLRRYLAGEAVLARPPSRGYLIRNYVARHRVQATAISVLALALIGWAATASYLLFDANQAREDVQLRKEHLQIAQDFFEQTIFSVDATEQGPETRMVDVLHAAAQRLESTVLPDEVAVTLNQSMGGTFYGLGAFETAREQLEEALRLGERVEGFPDEERFVILTNLAYTYRELGRWKEALQSAREAFEGRRSLHGLHAEDTLNSGLIYATLLASVGDADQATDLVEACLEAAEASFGAGSKETLHFLRVEAALCESRGDLARAESLSRRVARGFESLEGESHPRTIEALTGLASLLARREEYEEALGLFERAASLREELLGRAHPLCVRDATGVGVVLDFLGRSEEAVVVQRDALVRAQRVIEVDPELIWTVRSNLALALSAEENFEESDELLLLVLDHTAEVSGEESADFLVTLNNYARFLEKAGRPEEARYAYDQMGELIPQVLPLHQPQTATFYLNRGRNLMLTGTLVEAREALQLAYRALEGCDNLDSPSGRAVERLLAQVQLGQGAPAEVDSAPPAGQSPEPLTGEKP